MAKMYDELTVVIAISMVLTDASVECKNFLRRHWTNNREIAKRWGVRDYLYKDSVEMVRKAILRYRVKKWVSDNITDYLKHSAFKDRVSIWY